MTRSAPVCAVICAFFVLSALPALSACDMEQGHCPFPEGAEEVDYSHPDRYVAQSPATDPSGALGQAVRNLEKALLAKSSQVTIPELVNQAIHDHIQIKRDSSLVLARDASEVWESGFASGCHDYADVAAAFLRSVGCPVVFVETVHDSFLAGESHHGHVFLEVGLPSGDWMLYDPTNSRFWYDWTPGTNHLPGGYHVMGRYRDPWEAGLGSNKDLLACMNQAKENKKDME